jgi:hypothetical protein
MSNPEKQFETWIVSGGDTSTQGVDQPRLESRGADGPA